MSIITLTTDYGDQDFYAGALKGALLRACPGVQVVDISHRIQPFNIVQGAFVLQHAWREFPEGTIHCLAVNCFYGPESRLVALACDGHFFIAPDNGILTLLLDSAETAAARVLPSGTVAEPLPIQQIFARASAHLCTEQGLDTLGDPAGELLQRISLQPVVTPTRLRGTVIHIDNFENAVLNISRDLFERASNGRSFALFFKRNDPIVRISRDYSDVPVGETLCRFNDAGLLEIAINLGPAASLWGLKVEDVVEIVFDK